MDRARLTLNPRTVTGKKVKDLRKQGFVPVSICGKGIQSDIFQVDEKELGLVYRQAGRSGLIDLQLPNGIQSAFVREIQRNPVTDQFLHVDFRIVDLRTEITADVPIVATVENSLVEHNQGVLVMGLPTLHVRGLPANLPQAIEVDTSQITDFHSAIHVRDLDLGPDVEVLTPGDEVVATVTPSRMAAEQEELTAEAQPEEAPEEVVREAAQRAAEAEE